MSMYIIVLILGLALIVGFVKRYQRGVKYMSREDGIDTEAVEHQQGFFDKYIFSTDHKVIAKQFLFTGIFWAIVGTLLSLLMRIQLGFPEWGLSWLEPVLGNWIDRGRLDASAYLGAVTMHGFIMIFFVFTGGLIGTFANLLIPLQIGARDMASPVVNMLSYWFFFLSGIFMFLALTTELGPPNTGWTVYPPLSVVPQAAPGSQDGSLFYVLGLLTFIISSLLGSINYIATIINQRTIGMKFKRLPLTIWAFLFTAILALLSFPVLTAALLLLLFDHSFGTSFFLSNIYIANEALPHAGGSAIMFQHLFWFLGHPEVYIVFLPALGIFSEVISNRARKPIFGYQFMVASMFAITVLSFVVWAHHMFTSGMNPFLEGVFSVTTIMIAIPSAIKVFNYLTTLWKGNIILSPQMLFAMGGISFIISGGLTGLFVGNAPIDVHLHDTYFVVAHFHLVMGGVASFGLLAGIYHWFPKMFGKVLNRSLGTIHFWVTFISFYCVFFPMHYIGISGFPRRYYQFTNFDYMRGAIDINQFISIAAFVGFAGSLLFLYNIIKTIRSGGKSVQNPWDSNSLEWTTPIKPGHGNWQGQVPEVYRWPYDYSKPGSEKDFIPQTIPFYKTENSNMKGEEKLAEEQKGLAKERRDN